MADLTNPNSSSQPPSSTEDALPPKSPTVLRCLTGSLMAGSIAVPLYALTMSIAQSFASKPVHSDNITAIKISVAVRTLVVGMAALGTGVFAMAAVGLMLLAGQILIQNLGKKPTGGSL
ncbi:DUF3082 domain-containing protein [Microcoleus asticus]|uniref:DUF3082 domain-containing protein n=1 Tax=Microcoleus asticus IPMA8 TaxID=2563858 RepID=A0ABX2CPH7_9CYAN|nr:DUF3082 domain-containing protein [Microcoleus asticus]NQE32317.1 hypothetical protein [Microcoleus asticus IPMA8]